MRSDDSCRLHTPDVSGAHHRSASSACAPYAVRQRGALWRQKTSEQITFTGFIPGTALKAPVIQPDKLLQGGDTYTSVSSLDLPLLKPDKIVPTERFTLSSFVLSLLIHACILSFFLYTQTTTPPVPLPQGDVIEVNLIGMPGTAARNLGTARPAAPLQKQPTAAASTAQPQEKTTSAAKPAQQPKVSPAAMPTDSQQHRTQDTAGSSTAEGVSGGNGSASGNASTSSHAGTGQGGGAAPLGSQVNQKPSYPELARQRGQEGKVTLHVAVNAQGDPTNIRIQHSSGHSLLDQAALKTVWKWKFRAAHAAGRPVSGQTLVPVEFRLQ